MMLGLKETLLEDLAAGRWRPTPEPTGAPAQAQGAAGGDCQAAALHLDKIPQELKDRPQWLCYRQNKIPVIPKTGRPRSPVRVGG